MVVMVESKQKTVPSVVVHPLTGANYVTWKTQCKMALKEIDLWDIVRGTETEPDTQDEGVKRNFWRRKDRALATVVLTVDPSKLYLLGDDPEDPKLVWDTLGDQFQKKTWANKLALRRRLYSMRLASGESVDDHIKKMMEIFNELAVLGDPMEEEDRVIHLLASLPDSFDMLVTALEAHKEVPDMETVIERLRHEERKKIDKSDGGPEKALTSWEKSKRRCFRCNKVGHIKQKCPS